MTTLINFIKELNDTDYIEIRDGKYYIFSGKVRTCKNAIDFINTYSENAVINYSKNGAITKITL